MTTFQAKMRAYHAGLSTLRWRDDIYEFDRHHWRGVGQKRPDKAALLFAAHLRRVQGQGSPQECDDTLTDVIRR